MRYLSLFSGIEAASLAWAPLGWTPVAFSEVDPFCCELLRQRFPTVPNLGDVTADDFVDRAKALGPIDLVVGGSPCQSFSVAGLRKGLHDDRGNLTLRFVEVVHGIDPEWVVWENVPGVLNHPDNPFGCFLAGMVGADAPLVPGGDGAGVADRKAGTGGRWTGAGLVVGPVRVAAWRIQDAQWHRVAQRRRRVFVVSGRARDYRCAEVLLERAGVRGDPPTRRAKGEGVAVDVAPSLGRGGRNDLDGETYCVKGAAIGREPENGPQFGEVTADGTSYTLNRTEVHAVACFGGGNTSGAVDVATARSAKAGSRDDFDSDTFVAHSLRADGFDASEDGTKRGTPLVPVGVDLQNTALRTDGMAGTICGEGQASGNRAESVLCAAFDPVNVTSQANRTRVEPGRPCHTLHEGAPAVCFHATQDPISGEVSPAIGQGNAHGCGSIGVQQAMAVRRLTPRECERLQGAPDDWTLVTVRGKPAADGGRYKAIGNSMAVPCMGWIGRRIAEATR